MARTIFKNRERHQYIIHSSAAKTPEGAYPISPRGTIEVDVTLEEAQYIVQNYPVTQLGA